MKKFRTLLIVNALLMASVLIGLIVVGCGGGSGGTATTDPTNVRVNASNVLFRSQVEAAGKADEVSDVQVYADNVLLENSGINLSATNVQAAFEETEPILSEIIVGTWDVTHYKNSYTDTLKTTTGTITFNEDMTYQSDGDMSMFGWLYYDSSDDYRPIRYQVINNSMMAITFWYIDAGHNEKTVTKICPINIIQESKLTTISGEYYGIATKRQSE